MRPILSPPRLIALGLALLLMILFLFAAFHQDSAPIQSLKNTAQSAAKQLCPTDDFLESPPHYDPSHFGKTIHSLYAPIVHSVTAKKYVDFAGVEHRIEGEPHWTKGLGKKVLIVDMDTRIPNGKNGVWNPEAMNYEALDAEDGTQMVSTALLNHFMYSQIHGYDYKFFAVKHLKDMHDTWIKPHIIHEMLHDYQFVIFIDADAIIQHLELPLEWLFNKWGIGPNTTVAMPIDTQQILNGDRNASMDSRGRVELNTGFVVAQGIPLTFETMDAWNECPKGDRYEGCDYWANHWSHEQRAFSEYIRYDYNPDGNIVEIPCNDAMGFPGIVEKYSHILSNCTGQFVRHHTLGKGKTKTDTTNAVMQTMAQLMQKALLKDKEDFYVADGQTGSFMEKFFKLHD